MNDSKANEYAADPKLDFLVMQFPDPMPAVWRLRTCALSGEDLSVAIRVELLRYAKETVLTLTSSNALGNREPTEPAITE